MSIPERARRSSSDDPGHHATGSSLAGFTLSLQAHLRIGKDTTGAGVVLTGLTLAAGVATWIVAPLKFQADMGTVLTFMFLVNMVGAVVLLPALGAWLVRAKTPAS